MEIQYISNQHNKLTGVIVPIDLWHDIQSKSETETTYLLLSETMKNRLIEAKNRKEGIPFEKVCEKLGV